MGRRRGIALALGGLALAALLWPPAAGAAGVPMFDPKSGRADDIFHLFIYVIVLSLIVFAITETALFVFVFRFRDRGDREGEPEQIAGNRRLEMIWTAIPAVMLITVFVWVAVAMRQIGAAPPGGDPLTVEVIGHQWWWEFRYPDQQVVTANELHIPTGETIHMKVTSADVIHDFWVPQLGRKMDLIPGTINEFYLSADQPGTYVGTCAEFCGAQHAWMRIHVVAETPAQFNAWLAGQRQAAPAPSGDAARGEQAFLTGEGNCASCHTIAGTDAKGTVGPNLTHVGSRATLGAGVLTNTPAHMRQWLTNPQAVKPDNLMPNPQLTDTEVADIAAYLEGLR
ncbi:MAG TPA: cytochrome c oxidase subunit II [Thermomicrobiales bacterium]|nr:cytochrome c oxidase subunit II [Thermomicrobiales bacterium]